MLAWIESRDPVAMPAAIRVFAKRMQRTVMTVRCFLSLSNTEIDLEIDRIPQNSMDPIFAKAWAVDYSNKVMIRSLIMKGSRFIGSMTKALHILMDLSILRVRVL